MWQCVFKNWCEMKYVSIKDQSKFALSDIFPDGSGFDLLNCLKPCELDPDCFAIEKNFMNACIFLQEFEILEDTIPNSRTTIYVKNHQCPPEINTTMIPSFKPSLSPKITVN